MTEGIMLEALCRSPPRGVSTSDVHMAISSDRSRSNQESSWSAARSRSRFVDSAVPAEDDSCSDELDPEADRDSTAEIDSCRTGGDSDRSLRGDIRVASPNLKS